MKGFWTTTMSQSVVLSVIVLQMLNSILFYTTIWCAQYGTAIPFNNSTDSKQIVKIGFLGSFTYNEGIAKLIIGAIECAVDDINSNKNLLPNHTLDWIYGDVKEPNFPTGIQRMTKMWKENVIGFIGPDHTCESEAKVATAWNIPMILYMCNDDRISNKTLYPMIARTQPSASTLAKYLISFLLNFNWTKISLLVADTPSTKHVKESFLKLAEKQKITVLQTTMLPGIYTRRDLHTIKTFAKWNAQKARIFVIIADKGSVIDFAETMYEQYYSYKGNNAIIGVIDEDFKEKVMLDYMRIDREKRKFEKQKNQLLRCVFIVAPKSLSDTEEFEKKAMANNLKNMNLSFDSLTGVEFRLPIYARQAYDAVHVLAKAFTNVLEEDGNLTDGTFIMEKIRNQIFDSMLNYTFAIDEYGEVKGNYVVFAAVTNKTEFELKPVGTFNSSIKNGELPIFVEDKDINWIKCVPAAEPECGFDGEKCSDWKISFVATVLSVLLAMGCFLIFRKYRYEYKLTHLLWKINMKDITLLRTSFDYTMQNFRNTIDPQCLEQNSFKGVFESRKLSDSSDINIYRIGFYRGNAVHIRPVYKRTIDITRAILKEMVQMREMRHENINPFIGACVDYPNISIMTLYCSRGSLDEILQNEDLHLDNMFIASLVADLIKGMIYLHDSEIISHGNLKSSKCLVDNRWVLQITDFGLHQFKSIQEQQDIDVKKKRHGQLWCAPELLRSLSSPPCGTQKGDVYSFGIILYEIIGRIGPWGQTPLSAKCIVDRVMNPQHYGGNIYRPPTEQLICDGYIKTCMEECWNETPKFRPCFKIINVRLRPMQAGLKPNIFDNMMAIMEKYAYNLEGLVQERTNQLVEEKKKTEVLLLRMLPKSVADQLKRGEPVEAESFDSVTIYFSDIVGFTTISAISTPLQVVDLLNDLYICFDSIIENYDVYKVETIGDAYMVVSGLPIRNGDKHCTEIASMALHLLEAIENFEIRHLPRERLKLRIGIHSGSCVAGVVGLKMPRYCLFGDTVNTASRMESTGEALKIHVSKNFKTILDKQGGYIIKERGMTYIKGKGEMKTFWLLGKERNSPSNNIYNETKTHSQTFQDRTFTIINKGDTYLRLLNSDEDIENREERRKISNASSHPYNSCLSLFQEFSKNVLKEFRRSQRAQHNVYRSAPIIEYRSSFPKDRLL